MNDSTDIYAQNRVAYSQVLAQAAKTSAGWRLCTLIALLIAAGAVGGVVYIGIQSKIQPILVVLDERYVPVGLYQPGDGLTARDERVTRAFLAQFISTWRLVSIDATYQKRRINNLGLLIDQSSPAFNKIRAFIQDETTNPMLRARTETVDVHIQNILPVAGETWSVDWTETVTQRTTGKTTEQRFQANVTLTFLGEVPPELLLANPTGILITDINYSESTQ